jgi:hypothetical protein
LWASARLGKKLVDFADHHDISRTHHPHQTTRITLTNPPRFPTNPYLQEVMHRRHPRSRPPLRKQLTALASVRRLSPQHLVPLGFITRYVPNTTRRKKRMCRKLRAEKNLKPHRSISSHQACAKSRDSSRCCRLHAMTVQAASPASAGHPCGPK